MNRLEAVSDGGPSLSGLGATASRLRLGVETSFGDEDVWNGRMRLSGRRDGGVDLSGWGAEWQGALSWSSGRLDARLQGRALLSHTVSGYTDAGVGVSLGLRPRRNGAGLSFSLAPTWTSTGETGSGLGGGDLQLWGNERMTGLGSSAERRLAPRMIWEAELGYGFALGPNGQTLHSYVASRSDEWRVGWEVVGFNW